MICRLAAALALLCGWATPAFSAVDKFDLVGEWVGTPAPGATLRYVFKSNGEVVWIVEEQGKAPVRTEAHYTLYDGPGMRGIDIHDFDARQMRGIRLLGIMEPLTSSSFKFDGVPSNIGQRPATWTTNAMVLTSTNTALSAAISSVTIRGVTYSNVKVESVNEKTISISHSRGMASLNPKNLTDAERRALGLTTISLAQDIESKAAAPSVKAGRKPGAIVSSKFRDWLAAHTPEANPRNLGAIALAIVGAMIGFYLFTCLCLLCICNKTDNPAPFRVWIPILQVHAAYAAAGMPTYWFRLLVLDLLLFRIPCAWLAAHLPPGGVPTGLGLAAAVIAIGLSSIHLAGWVIWCFKICVARGKSAWLGLFVLFPITQPPALGYLAFSK